MADVHQQDVASFGREDAENYSSGGVAAFGAHPAVAQRRQAALQSAIESLVIPRLVQSHRAAGQTPAAAVVSGVLTPQSVREFARLILLNEVPAAAAFIATLRADGASLDTLYLDLLAPAARWLGELWKEDLADFTEVTTGLWRLQQVLRELGAAFHEEAAALDPNRAALLVPAPGEQHTFGLVMVAEFFRRAGWSVWSATPETPADLLGMVRSDWFAVIGYSVGCEARLETLAASIRQVRRASRNRRIGVMVGGPLFVEHPELVGQVGADTTAADGRDAVLHADELLGGMTDAGRESRRETGRDSGRESGRVAGRT